MRFHIPVICFIKNDHLLVADAEGCKYVAEFQRTPLNLSMFALYHRKLRCSSDMRMVYGKLLKVSLKLVPACTPEMCLFRMEQLIYTCTRIFLTFSPNVSRSYRKVLDKSSSVLLSPFKNLTKCSHASG